MLERVPLLERDLATYRDIVGDEALDRIRELAEPLQGARVLHVNATAYGGGVAELLATLVPLMRSAGLRADWQVISGSDEFFAVTKAVHNGLQGMNIEWTSEMQEIYLERVQANAAAFEGEWDFVVMHDPQLAAMLQFLEDDAPPQRAAARGTSKHWIWRCHIDLTEANQKVWEFYRPFVERHDASIWTMSEFVPASLNMPRVVTFPPCIDPLSTKNLDLARPFVEELCRQYGISVAAPIVCQVSRFDLWKDPVGVIEAFRLVRREVTDAQLVLAGSMATDDPEGFHMWELTEAARDGDPDIHLLSNIQQVGSVQINAFQRAADVVLQKSLREGFGLTVSEALWKGRPVVGGNVGGITLQIRDGEDGYLVDSVEACAERTIELLRNPTLADRMGVAGREHVRRNFLSTRNLEDYLKLFNNLAGNSIPAGT